MPQEAFNIGDLNTPQKKPAAFYQTMDIIPDAYPELHDVTSYV
jgi:hypothetical protein